MMRFPKVSICIPAYKSTNSLQRLLDSILIQSFTNYEIVISDDTPDESVLSLVESYSDSRIRIYHNTSSLGSPENWNHAVQQASGDIIKIMHHDDWFSSGLALERMVSVMEEKEADILFVQSRNQNAEVVLSVNAPNEKDINEMKDHPFSLFFKNIIGAPSATLYKRKDLKFDRNLRWFVDVDFYSSMIASGAKIAYLPEELICIGVDGPRVTNEYQSNFANIAQEFFYSWSKCRKDGRLPIVESYYWLYRFLKEHETLGFRAFLPFMNVFTIPVALALWIILKIKTSYSLIKKRLF